MPIILNETIVQNVLMLAVINSLRKTGNMNQTCNRYSQPEHLFIVNSGTYDFFNHSNIYVFLFFNLFSKDVFPNIGPIPVYVL